MKEEKTRRVENDFKNERATFIVMELGRRQQDLVFLKRKEYTEKHVISSISLYAQSSN